jgi:hypothetical protein
MSPFVAISVPSATTRSLAFALVGSARSARASRHLPRRLVGVVGPLLRLQLRK